MTGLSRGVVVIRPLSIPSWKWEGSGEEKGLQRSPSGHPKVCLSRIFSTPEPQPFGFAPYPYPWFPESSGFSPALSPEHPLPSCGWLVGMRMGIPHLYHYSQGLAETKVGYGELRWGSCLLRLASPSPLTSLSTGLTSSTLSSSLA